MTTATRQAIRAHLLADTDVTELLADPKQGVYYKVAPSLSKYPFIVFHRVPGSPIWTFRDFHREERWVIKAVAKQSGQAEAIADAVRDSLNDADLEIAGAALLCFRYERDIDFPEFEGENVYQHVGCQFRFSARPVAEEGSGSGS